MSIRSKLAIGILSTLAITHAETAMAQLGGLTGAVGGAAKSGAGASGSGSASAATSANVARLQTQLQQRIQLQAQVLQRAQSQSQRGVNTAIRTAQTTKVGSDANVSAQSQANLGNSAQVNGNAKASVQARAKADDIDVGLFDSILGRFNPFRETDAALTASSASNVTRSSQRGTGSNQPTSTSPQGASQEDKTPIVLVSGGAIASGNHAADVNVRIRDAIRLRRAEISELRDKAIASASIELMARADEMETMLNAFQQAQVQAAANAQGSAKSTAENTNSVSSTTQAKTEAKNSLETQNANTTKVEAGASSSANVRNSKTR